MLNAIKHKSNQGAMYYQVAEILSEYIRNNKLMPGDKIPSERQLCTLLKVSRNSIREGLRLMENQGIISTKVGIGSFVEREITDDSIRLQFVKIDFAETLEVKLMLEKEIAAEWIKHATDIQIAKLEILARELLTESLGDVYPYELDEEFHSMLAEFIPNKLLKNILKEIHYVINEQWRHFVPDARKLNSTIPLHVDLVQCIKERDEKSAKEAYKKLYETDIAIIENSKPANS